MIVDTCPPSSYTHNNNKQVSSPQGHFDIVEVNHEILPLFGGCCGVDSGVCVSIWSIPNRISSFGSPLYSSTGTLILLEVATYRYISDP